MKPSTPGRSARRLEGGTVLYLGLFMVAFLNLLALAYVKCIPVEANSYLRSQRAVLAHYACEAGVFDTMAWIRHELKFGREPSTGGVVTRRGSHGEWTWRVELRPDGQSPPAGRSSLRFYEMTSRAWAPNLNPDRDEPSRIIRVTMGEETFARYSYFIDYWNPGIHQYLLSGGRFIEGHLHTNTFFRIKPTEATYSGNEVSYAGYVTSAGSAPNSMSHDGVYYLDAAWAPHDGEGEPIGDRYEKLFMGGLAGLNTGVNRIEMPDTSMGLLNRAWGEELPAGALSPGVNVNVRDGMLAGGIVVDGEIAEMKLVAVGQNASVVEFTLGSPGVEPDPEGGEAEGGEATGERYKLMEVFAGSAQLDGVTISAGSTGLSGPGGVQRFEGLTNGVFHCTGNIHSLHGVNLGARLISADIASQKFIRITNHILRADTPTGSRPRTPRDVLGLVAHRVLLGEDVPRTGGTVHLYLSYVTGGASVYPQGGFVVEGRTDPTKPYSGFSLYGSVGAGTNFGTGDGTVGFGYQVIFDEHLIENPPPFYPTTGKLPIRSWREMDGAL